MTPPDLADVLAEVNRLRAERDLPPLDAMPKGERQAAFSCPIAKACGKDGSASDRELWFDGIGGTDRIATPRVIRDFLDAFDAGLYPELVAS